MDLRKMIDMYYEEGLPRELAASRVCQDVVLKAIALGPFSRNVTIKGGVVMRNLTNNNRRATRDIDLDFIHYSIGDEEIRVFCSENELHSGNQDRNNRRYRRTETSGLPWQIYKGANY